MIRREGKRGWKTQVLNLLPVQLSSWIHCHLPPLPDPTLQTLTMSSLTHARCSPFESQQTEWSFCEWPWIWRKSYNQIPRFKHIVAFLPGNTSVFIPFLHPQSIILLSNVPNFWIWQFLFIAQKNHASFKGDRGVANF